MSDFNLGTVTAYGYAKDKGYTGTEDEYAELMASYADVAEQAAESAEQAAASATTATAKASEAAQSATSAASSKTAAETAQGGAETAAQTATTKAGEATTAATTATNKATEATTAAGTATTKASEATTAATTATTKAGEASTSATNAAASATRAQEILDSIPEDYSQLSDDVSDLKDGLTAVEDDVADVKEDITAETEARKAADDEINTALESKAEIDGYYESMTVGNAEQLVSSVGINDSVPYNFRTSGGSADIGDRLTDKVVGGTIAWNQQHSVNAISWTSYRGISITKVSDTTIKVSGTVNSSSQYDAQAKAYTIKDNIIPNHVYLITGLDDRIMVYFGNMYPYLKGGGIGKATTISESKTLFFNIKIGTDFGEGVEYTPMFFDLTQMFGSTIADYVYSLEQSTAGAGVAWFRKLFPKDYYEYNAGELMSVQTSSHDTVGFNAFNGVWNEGTYLKADGSLGPTSNSYATTDYIPILPNTTYYGHMVQSSVDSINIAYYDAEKNFIPPLKLSVHTYKNHADTTPSDAYFMRITITKTYTSEEEFCINLHWDGERDGEYEPYVKHSYPLDSDLVLRGIPKLDASNSLYYDGDTYESDGTVTRRYGVVDLGTLDWGTYSSTYKRFYATISDIKKPDFRTVGNAVCQKYVAVSVVYFDDHLDESAIFCVDNNNSRIWVRDLAYTDRATLKTALSGVMLVYELATPTTETADPYQNPQIVDDFGTEEYVDAGSRDVAIPVGHETFYAANLKAKLEMSPDSPSDGDGDYIVRQTNGINEYVKMVKELPTMPTTNGTYHLEVTVASGTPTLTWVANE